MRADKGEERRQAGAAVGPGALRDHAGEFPDLAAGIIAQIFAE
jgi:hypothetical protein